MSIVSASAGRPLPVFATSGSASAQRGEGGREQNSGQTPGPQQRATVRPLDHADIGTGLQPSQEGGGQLAAGRHYVITGTSSGIGQRLARHLVERGAHVIGIARSPQDGYYVGSGAFIPVQCDVSVYSSVHYAASMISQFWQHADGLVACAGIQGDMGPALGVDPVRWAASTRANIEGAYNTLYAFDSLLRRAPGHAKAIVFSGGGATKARPNFSPYGCAKTALIRLVETIALERAGWRYDINAVAPGAIHTAMTETIIAAGPEATGYHEYTAALALRQVGGESLARALALIDFLLSPRSDGITGRLIAAQWDEWEKLTPAAPADLYTLRRIT